MTALKLPGVMANLMVKIDPPKVQAVHPLTGCISHSKSCLLLLQGHGLPSCELGQ